MNTLIQEKPTAVNTQFFNDVIVGLTAEPKSLSSKYFYDERGDAIFQQIMEMEEYYLTNAEMEIFVSQSAAICEAIAKGDEAFDLIELGAGDATKSIHLLKALINRDLDFSYLPIDISAHVIEDLEANLPLQLPKLKIKGFNGDYFEMLSQANKYSNRRKVVLFMGANIGNMSVEDAQLFCEKLRKNLSKDDLLLVGFDLKKNPSQILAAYNDKNGITKSFNLNLLARMNRELQADFEVDNFDHYACYDPQSGACKSYLISLAAQTVTINDKVIHFQENEYIFMEISQKYALAEVEKLAKFSGFNMTQNFLDDQNYFVDTIWKVSE
ncbi:L-histidine N(alpha)-methyltransferase [Pedobacter changchengzhani]|uniref:L-histidine N(Alpha)-methyltransferase n=1 Tax=Pedobacter changchengzhani TaxID=2529274 RepID=A0A4R5MK23_9SPHI|nr:L-histidine N(alpha)-methyltransferase [Pedobacter changchengzhani]TDG36004.1 L-histidine N(alpha)-methyltransferase [Pedobacter changchengzhani]